MSQPNLAEQLDETAAVESEPTLEQPQAEIPTQKQKTDIYTVMLIVSFICLLLACILLLVELNRWGTFPGRPWDTSSATPKRQALNDHTPVESTSTLV